MANDPFDLTAYVAALRERIDAVMIGFLDDGDGPDDRLVDAMRYSLTAGGKRIRPILCCAAAEALGGRREEALPAACAIEMIHTYSLIHDDLPAMDDDDLRRGKPTCHRAFDEATAILAGDALMALAFEVIAAHGYPSAAPAVRAEAVRILAQASGIRGMAQGQMIDIQSEGRRLSLEELTRLHALKTGAMIEASLALGGLAAGGSAEELARLAAYGRSVGLAFQVVDDILNVEGDPALLGKSVGTDEIRLKNSFPALMGLEKSKEFAHNLESEALAAIAGLDRRAEPLRAIAGFIIRRRR
jgi:geranylgeranyl diphosphate synthase type II